MGPEKVYCKDCIHLSTDGRWKDERTCLAYPPTPVKVYDGDWYSPPRFEDQRRLAKDVNKDNDCDKFVHIEDACEHNFMSMYKIPDSNPVCYNGVNYGFPPVGEICRKCSKRILYK
jgi:hypothetical protein